MSDSVLFHRIGGTNVDRKTGSITIPIEVINLNEQPVVPDITLYIDENSIFNTKITPAVSASDPDNENNPGLQQLTFKITSSNIPYRIDPLSGHLYSQDSIDFETNKGRAVFSVTATDPQGFESAAATVTVLINDVNEPPIMAQQTREIYETLTAGDIFDSPLECSDPDAGDNLSMQIVGNDAVIADTDTQIFSVDNNGQLRLEQTVLDFERRNAYSVRINCTDSQGLTTTAYAFINVSECTLFFSWHRDLPSAHGPGH